MLDIIIFIQLHTVYNKYEAQLITPVRSVVGSLSFLSIAMSDVIGILFIKLERNREIGRGSEEDKITISYLVRLHFFSEFISPNA